MTVTSFHEFKVLEDPILHHLHIFTPLREIVHYLHRIYFYFY